MSDPGRDNLTTHLARLYRVALRLVGKADVAEDVVQDVCVRTLERHDGFRGESSLATWLHRMTVNCAIDRLRRDGRRDRGRVAADDVLGAIESLEAAPEESLERQELRGELLSLVASLPDDCRGAFVLTQLDGYTYDEAAEIEGRPRGTIASRVARAKGLLLAAAGDVRCDANRRNGSMTVRTPTMGQRHVDEPQ